MVFRRLFMNDKLKETINEAADKLYGMDNLIHPKVDPRTNTYVPTYSESGSSYELPTIPDSLFTDGFWDCLIALCLSGGFISLTL